MGRKAKPQTPATPEPIPCALELPDGRYLENDLPHHSRGNGFEVKGGEIHLSPSSFAPMDTILEKRKRIQDLIRMHNTWAADELAGLNKAERDFWGTIMDKLSIPRGTNITINWRGVITRVKEEKKEPD